MTIKIVTDSTCNLPTEYIEYYGLEIIPINVLFGTTGTYKENVTLTPDDFYKLVEEKKILPTTSQPSVGEFIEIYEALSDEADEIISIHVTSKLSGTYQNATLAADIVANKVKVYPFDSLSSCVGLGWLACEAASLIESGKSAMEIIEILTKNRAKITTFFAVDDLKYAQMSGRVGKMASLLTSILNIKPIIGAKQGELNVFSKVRSTKTALKCIVDLTQEEVQNQPVNIAVVQAQTAPDKAEQLVTLAKSILNVKGYLIVDLSISLATHFGPGTLGLVAYPTEQDLL